MSYFKIVNGGGWWEREEKESFKKRLVRVRLKWAGDMEPMEGEQRLTKKADTHTVEGRRRIGRQWLRWEEIFGGGGREWERWIRGMERGCGDWSETGPVTEGEQMEDQNRCQPQKAKQKYHVGGPTPLSWSGRSQGCSSALMLSAWSYLPWWMSCMFRLLASVGTSSMICYK